MRLLAAIIDRNSLAGRAVTYRAVHHTAVVAGVAAIIAETQRNMPPAFGWVALTVIHIVAVLMAVDFGLRFAAAGEDMVETGFSRRFTISMAIDCLAALALPAAWLLGVPAVHAHLPGLIWLLKLGRHFNGLRMLGRILRNMAEPLSSVLVGFLIILVFSATAAYLIEGEEQPEAFGSIPEATWWAIVTLTTTGYGDVTPHTFAGRMLGGLVMACGIAVFGLWAGILASGFVDELRRRNFLSTWGLVAGVPFFRDLGADVIAEVAGLLKRRVVGPRTAVVRAGEAGDTMYFIADGEVEVRLSPKPIRLGDGSFFGEMALVTGAPRNATVVTTRQSLLLELDVADFRMLAGRLPQLTAAIQAEANRRGVRPAAVPVPLPVEPVDDD